jgi:hypothetical protein
MAPEKPALPPPGLSRPTTTPVPDEIFDLWLPHLSEAELKVLLYICRRTLGFKKDTDPIALSQLTHGIVRRDGTRLDSGSGVSESSVVRGVKGLLAKGLIVKEEQTSPSGGYATTYYGLNWRGLAPSLHGERRGAEGPVNLTPPLLASQKEQESDVTTHREIGSNALIENALRQLCKARGWPAPTRADYDVMSAAWQASGQDATTFAAALPLRTHGARSVAEAARQLGEG